ncbi:restriction endonuclease subunit S [Vibrio cyclitrophicus]|uniref:restriction endonuclease subunit S n=1 Tax=Vibrio cyclitrophicus TaxID=47951 RepID=UPI000C859532|nr:restriction endonuclease subunit S [Vibrio cyclitrophicus]PMF48071.1 hypothetical protein BCV14_02030 [Vibrio cyclitrophicus]
MNFDYSLPEGWSWKTIEQIQESPKGATITGPFGSSIGKKFFVEQGIPVIRGNNLSLKMIPFIDDGFVFVSEEKAEELKRYKSKADDLLFTAAGTIGQVGIIPQTSNFDEYIISNKQLRARLDRDLVDPLYAYYWFSSKPMVEYIKRQDTGSTIPLINLGVLRALPIPVAPLDAQVKIRKILESFDKKIEVNQKTNKTLEQMAQAIFKSWFVDFDPVKAKMNGEQPEGMDAATASLFPEKLVESELGLIPEGWGAVQVGDIVQRLKPKKRYTKKQVEPYGKTPVYEQGASILLGFHNDDAGFDASPEDPVFIFGDHTCITHLSCSKFDISSNVIPLKGSVRPTIWTYYAIQGKQEFQEYRRHWSEFIIKDVVLPPVELAEKYAELVTTKYLMMESLKRQSKELEQLRDTLLPKLLSGEINLDTTEELVEVN